MTILIILARQVLDPFSEIAAPYHSDEDVHATQREDARKHHPLPSRKLQTPYHMHRQAKYGDIERHICNRDAIIISLKVSAFVCEKVLYVKCSVERATVENIRSCLRDAKGHGIVSGNYLC